MITHIVKKTDTLEGISLRYNVPIAKIKKINKIYSNNILLCLDKILIPEDEDTSSIGSKNQPNSINSGVENTVKYTNLPNIQNSNDNNSINNNNNSTTINKSGNNHGNPMYNFNNTSYNSINSFNSYNSNNNNNNNNTVNNIIGNPMYNFNNTSYNSISSFNSYNVNNNTYNSNNIIYNYNNNSSQSVNNMNNNNNNNSVHTNNILQGYNYGVKNSESVPNSPKLKNDNNYDNYIGNDTVSERIDCNRSFISTTDTVETSSKMNFKRSTSEISSLDEILENIDRSVMETVNKNKITLPLLIKTQLEVYQDIPIYDPSKDEKLNNNNSNNDLNMMNSMTKSHSFGSFNKNNSIPQNIHSEFINEQEEYLRHSQSMLISNNGRSTHANDSYNSINNKHIHMDSNHSNSQSSLSFAYDGYISNDYNYKNLSSEDDRRSFFLKNEHEKISKIMDKLSISTNMDGIHNLVNRLSTKDDVSSASSEPVYTHKYKHSNDYLELAKIV